MPKDVRPELGLLPQVIASPATDLAPVRALMSIPCISYGVGMTCRSIISGAAARGFRADLFTSRFDVDPITRPVVHSVLPSLSRLVPYARLKSYAERELHARYLKALAPGEIAYLWPSVPLHVFEAVRSRGNPIIAEAVNTRMEFAKPVLDAAYDALGLEPNHGITDDRVREQAARYDLCSGIFAPSPATEAALAGSPLERRYIASSYGTWVPKSPVPQRPHRDAKSVLFLFVGLVCVRKGSHHLLQAWRRMPSNYHLRMVGTVEPALEAMYGDVFDLPNVSLRSFTQDVASEYRNADVFVLPSLEEGDSIVCYEAASFGLPVIASRIGAGRIGARSGAVRIIDTSDVDAFSDELARYGGCHDLRVEWGRRAFEAVQDYDWAKVAPQTFSALRDFLVRLSPR